MIKKIGLIILVIGFLIILLNATNYIGKFAVFPQSSIIIGLLLTGIGAVMCYKKK